MIPRTDGGAPGTPLPPGRHVLVALVLVALVAVAVGLLAGRVHPALLATGVAVALGGAALHSDRRRRSARQDRHSPVLGSGRPWRDLMPCYLSAQDRDLRIVDSNAMFRETFGDRIGEHCFRVYKHRDAPCPDCLVLKTFADGQPHTSQERVITATGELADFVVTSTPLVGRDGRVVAVAEMSTNITELVVLRQQLARQKRDFEQLFDLVPCYVSVQDRELRIVESNELFRQDFGDCTGQHCYRAYKGRTSICPACPVHETFADGEIHSSQETVVTADGREAQVMTYSAPIREQPGGPVTAVMELSTNITEVKQLQRELALMGMAIAGMAHRVKNILMGLEGGIFVVNSGFEADEQHTISEGWEMVERNVAKISRIVKDLLYCSKERRPRFRDQVSPAQVLSEVHELYRERTRHDDIELRLEVDHSPHPGRFDPDGLHNLLSNLTANAVDACRFDARRRHHTVTLRCYQSGAMTVFEVEDDGPGVPDDVHHRVFENFFSTKGTEGTGLGLLVVQKIAAEHGGSVSFFSESGDGTTFRVALPSGEATEESPPETRDPKPDQASPPT